MGIAMAGMLASSLTTLPNGAWEVIFARADRLVRLPGGARRQANGVRALAGGHCAPHLVHSAAMLYMFLAITAPAARRSGMSGMGGDPSGMTTLSVSHPGVRLRADPDRLHDLGPRPAVQPLARPRPGRRRGGSPALVARAGLDPRPDAGTGVAAGSGAGGLAAGSPDGSGDAGPGSTAGGGRSGALSILDSPGTVVGCRIAMGVTMALMLLLML